MKWGVMSVEDHAVVVRVQLHDEWVVRFMVWPFPNPDTHPQSAVDAGVPQLEGTMQSAHAATGVQCAGRLGVAVLRQRACRHAVLRSPPVSATALPLKSIPAARRYAFCRCIHCGS